MDLLQEENLNRLLAAVRTASGLPSDIQWIVAVWFLMIGGCFGSLMNVIIYRWPAGMSIVLPASRCPRCLHPIRLYDNIPVLSWIFLGARCRDCRARIPIRYPSVEAVVAVLFFTFFVVEVIYGGVNLPEATVSSGGARAARPPEILWGIFGLHMLLICTLLCAVLIEFDGHKPPAKLVLPPLVITALAIILWPELRPASDLSRLDFVSRMSAGVLGILAGSIVGGLAGWLVDSFAAARQGKGRGFWSIALACVVGVAVGWSAVILICLATGMFVLVATFEQRLRPRVRVLPASSYLTIATLLLLLYWRLIDQTIRRMGD